MPTLSKRQWIMAFVIVAIFFGAGVQYGILRAEKELTNSVLIADAKQADSVFVAIEGAVKSPGMYEMNRGDRLADLLSIAVLADNADLSQLNRAQKLVDEDFFYIPEKEVKAAAHTPSKKKASSSTGSASQGTAEVKSAKVNIAKASLDELMALPGITKSKAAEIIVHRTADPFVQIYDLQDVKGITAEDWLNVKDLITVNYQ